VELPVVSSLPIGFPTRRLLNGLQDFRPDVVHLASPFVVGARGLAAARKLGVPSVAVYQTDIAGFAGSYGLGLTARAAWRWVCRLHSGAARTLAPSTWAAEALRERGVPRVHQWGRGVDTERFAPEHRDDALRAELAPRGELLVGYVGRLAPEKHIERLSALRDVPGVRVVIVGEGPQRPLLEEALPGAVFLGLRTGEELARIYASLDVFVHTGPHETFGQTVQEALASGLPVIAPATGGPVDLVTPGETGALVPPEDPTAIATAVAELAADPTLRRRYSAAARATVANRTWDTVGNELLAHYRSVLAGPGVPSYVPVAA
jgi:phosphatidylinositol alpha 1,6-mannosyltransferase